MTEKFCQRPKVGDRIDEERKSLTRHARRGRFPIRLTTGAALPTPESENGQLAFLQIGCVCALEDYTGDAGVTESWVAEIDDQSKRKVHQLHV